MMTLKTGLVQFTTADGASSEKGKEKIYVW